MHYIKTFLFSFLFSFIIFYILPDFKIDWSITATWTGAIATTITAILIYKQAKEANRQTNEMVKQNQYINDYEIYKETNIKIQEYFMKINSIYKQDSYLTYFYYKQDFYHPSYPVSKFYLDDKDFLDDDNKFKEAISETVILLNSLEFIVGNNYYKLKRVSRENLEILLRPIVCFLTLKKDTYETKKKEFKVSYLYYVFWCYDGKEGKIEFSYPNLLNFFKENNKINEFYISTYFIDYDINRFVSRCIDLIDYFYPNKYDETYKEKTKTAMIKDFTEYVNSNARFDNTLFLYFRFYFIYWHEIFATFIFDTCIIKENKYLKPVFDRQRTLCFTIETSEKINCDFSLIDIDDNEKEIFKNIHDGAKDVYYELEHYYEKYRNFEKACDIFLNTNSNVSKWGSDISYFVNVFHGFPEINDVFYPYANKLHICYIESFIILKILEECEIYSQQVKINKLNKLF